MAAYRIVFSKRAHNDLKKLSPAVQKRMRAKLEFFLDSAAPVQSATALTKPADAQYRWGVGSYRVLFDQLPDGTIAVVKIQHRKEVYR